ncbi:MAG: hypothetical protein EHM33_02000 [Chloroflexi bacterium]|nr:MAG: hypothetical protein EHM33_02000 [Chloroflexota bacterium]
MNDLWLFIEHGRNNTWTRAFVPNGVKTVRDMIGYLQRGGKVLSDWMDIPERAKFIPRAAGMTVLARLVEP